MRQIALCLPSSGKPTLKSARSCWEIDGPRLVSKIPPIHAFAPFQTLVRNPRARDCRQKFDFRLIRGSSQNGEVHFAPGDTMAGRQCSLSLGRSALLHGRVVHVTLREE